MLQHPLQPQTEAPLKWAAGWRGVNEVSSSVPDKPLGHCHSNYPPTASLMDPNNGGVKGDFKTGESNSNTQWGQHLKLGQSCPNVNIYWETISTDAKVNIFFFNLNMDSVKKKKKTFIDATVGKLAKFLLVFLLFSKYYPIDHFILHICNWISK